MLHKKHTYEACGVREYWLVNLEKQTLTQYVLEDGEFEQQHFSFDEEVASKVLEGYKVRLRAIMEHV